MTVDEARQAVEAAIRSWGNPDLVVGEVMIFDNHAYVEIMERSTGMGALEVLVDPVTHSVYPEFGPNRMWNRKYHLWGRMARLRVTPDVEASMPIRPSDALSLAQAFLDAQGLGQQVGDEVTPFYGYYTLHIEQGGRIVGMLSVNGYTGEVMPHTWHGTFLEMSTGR